MNFRNWFFIKGKSINHSGKLKLLLRAPLVAIGTQKTKERKSEPFVGEDSGGRSLGMGCLGHMTISSADPTGSFSTSLKFQLASVIFL